MNKIKPVPLACIVDDDDLYSFALERMMKMGKFADSILCFPNGKEAFVYLQMVQPYPDQLPDVIFLDINMPEMNGWQFLENFSRIRTKLAKQVSIYILSSSISTNDIQRAKSYTTVSDYLIKPITKEDLVRVLEEVTVNTATVNTATVNTATVDMRSSL